MLAAFEVVPSSFECFNDYQQLTVVSLIPSLRKIYLSREKGYRMPLTRIIRG